MAKVLNDFYDAHTRAKFFKVVHRGKTIAHSLPQVAARRLSDAFNYANRKKKR